MEPHTLSLTAHLQAAAAAWCLSNEDSQARLGRLVKNDSAFFTTLAEGRGQGPTERTLSQFAAFLGDPGNWPAEGDGGGAVPQVVRDFVHRVNGTPPPVAASTGQAGEISRDAEGAPC